MSTEIRAMDRAQQEVVSDSDDPSEPLLSKTRGSIAKFSVHFLIEPVVFLYSVYVAGSFPLNQQFVYELIAQEHNTTAKLLRNFSSCGSESNDTEYVLQRIVQAQTSSWLIYLNAVQIPVVLFITIFLGGYTDKGGRKVGLFVPVLGSMVRTMLTMAVIYFRLPLPFLFLCSITEALGGGFACFLMASFSFLSDVTSHSDRAIRIVILEATLGIGVIVGQLSLGYLLENLGYMYSYVMLGVLLTVLVLYALVILNEPRPGRKPKVFQLEHMRHVARVYTKEDGSGRRWKLLLTLVLLTIFSVTELGRMDVQTLFVLNTPLCFTSEMIGYFGMAMYGVSSVGSLIGGKLFQPKIGEMAVLLIGCFSGLGRDIFTAFSTTNVMIFSTTIVGFYARLPIQMLRSYASKIVTVDEQGGMYAAVAWIQSSCALGGSILLTTIYKLTLGDFLQGGSVFLACAAFYVLGAVLGGILIVKERGERRIELPYPEVAT